MRVSRVPLPARGGRCVVCCWGYVGCYPISVRGVRRRYGVGNAAGATHVSLSVFKLFNTTYESSIPEFIGKNTSEYVKLEL